MARIDFSPLLARNLVRNQMVNEAGFDLGQLAGENWNNIGKGLGKGYDKLKGFGGGILGMLRGRENPFTQESIEDPNRIYEEPGVSEEVMTDKKSLSQKMSDNEGLFQGGMQNRPLGRLRDEMDIKKSQLGGLFRGLPYQGQGNNITKYKNGQIVPTPGQGPNARPVPMDSSIFSRLYNENNPTKRLDIPGINDLPQWMKSPAEQLGIGEDASETEIQDALMKWNEEGRTTGQAEGNPYNYDFSTDLMQTPTLDQSLESPYYVEGYQNAINANKLYQDQTNWWGN